MSTTWQRAVERLVGAATVLLGTVVLIGWTLDEPTLKSVRPGLPAMKANTALGFVLSGLAFWLASSQAPRRRAKRVAAASSGVVLVGCGLTLFQYLTGWNLGLDQALFADATSSGRYPGRMPPNTALAFLLLASALLLLSGEANRARLTGVALLGALTALLASYKAVTGYLGHGAIGYGGSELTAMTPPAVVAFALLGMACLTAAWRAAGLRLAIAGRPLAGLLAGLAIFLALGVVSYRSAGRLAEGSASLRPPNEVLVRLREVDSDVTEVQTTVRGFVITGQEEFLAAHQEAGRKLDGDERSLRSLVTNDPVQQRHLTTLGDLIRERKAFSAQAADLRRHRGIEAAASLISTGRGQQIMGQIRRVIGTMEGRERDRLAQLEADNRTVTSRALLIWPVGTFIGLTVLVALLFSLNAEAADRQQAQATGRDAAAIVESTDDAVITKTLEGVITSWNAGAERILGYTAQEAVGRPVRFLIPPERANEEAEILGRIGRGERVEHFETERQAKDGRRLEVSVTVSPVRDGAGKIVGASKILRDVTERKATAEQLQELGRRLTTTLESMHAAFFTLDREWRFSYINRECERLLRRTREDLLGKGIWEEFKEAIGGPSYLNYQLAASENRSVEFEEFYPPLGMWLEVSAHPSPEGLAVYFHDISPRKRAEEAIRDLNADLERRVAERTAELEASNRELGAFTYSVSHDLRAPLRAIDGFSQALLEDFGPTLPEEGRRQARTIREGAQRMGALIDDLLAFSRLGRQSLASPVVVDMDGLVREALQELMPEQQGRRIEIRAEAVPPARGDRALLKQVWINLLSNALKYTRKCDPAVVEIGSALRGSELVYFVRDNGKGFDMKYAHKLFGVFQRLHRAEEFEGTGVGLAIVQRIVHRHGGGVCAQSAVDRGATFEFTLPRGAGS